MVKNSKKQPTKKTRKFDLKKPGHLIIAVLLVLLVGLFVKNRFDIYQGHQLFKQAEAKTEAVYKQVVEITGEPDKVVREKTCGRASRKFEKGQLSCSVSIHSMVVLNDFTEANEHLNALSKLSSQPLRVNSLTQDIGLGFVKNEGHSERQQFNQKITDLKTISCNFSYEYPVNDKSAYYDLLKPQTPENLRIGISCGGPAKAEHYPLRD